MRRTKSATRMCINNTKNIKYKSDTRPKTVTSYPQLNSNIHDEYIYTRYRLHRYPVFGQEGREKAGRLKEEIFGSEGK